jgi:hypothetical protein
MTVTMFYCGTKIERKSPNSSCSEKQVLVLYSRIPLSKLLSTPLRNFVVDVNMKSFGKINNFSSRSSK